MSHSTELLEFTRALARSIEDSVRVDPPAPDLADVLARARVIDEAAIPSGLLAAVDERLIDDDDRPEPALAAFTAAMREQIEGAAHDRQLAPVPSTPPRPIASRRHVIAAAVTLAAALVLMWGWPRLRPWLAEPDRARDPMGAAGAVVDDGDGARTVVPQPDPPTRPRTPELLEAAPELEPATADAQGDGPTDHARVGATRGREAPTLDELEANARERWAAGDLEGAQALFRRVVRRAGRGSRAELAYGDLFALARQLGGGSAQAAMWREYLRKFPRGRYADDVRGGLCRAASATDRVACWSEYAKRHPQGAHAAEARDVLDGADAR